MLLTWRRGKNQTALGKSGQSVHEDRAAAPSIWQVLLFAEASCEHVKLHCPVSPAAPMGPADFYKSFICSAFPPLQPRDLLGVCIAEPWPRFFSLSLN